MEKFNLSEKEIDVGFIKAYSEKDVKEFIRLLKEEFRKGYVSSDRFDVFKKIDALAGDKLK